MLLAVHAYSDARTELLAGKMAYYNYYYMASDLLSVCTGVNGLC